ncbi:MAG: MBL fold metallo-hydrolase [Phycisphaeraceae bacterium]
MPNDLHIETFTLGDWMTNCYVLHADADGGPCWIIDLGFDPEPVLDYIDHHDLTPHEVILTHGHVDHVAGLPTLRRRYLELPILIHEAERDFPGDPLLNLSIVLDPPVIAPDPDGMLVHGQHIDIAGLTFEVRHTPGHSPGGITLYQPDQGVAIVGDALFAGSIGRTDFPTSDPDQLIRSIREQLLTLPDNTRVLPGHGPATRIAHERATNPFIK